MLTTAPPFRLACMVPVEGSRKMLAGRLAFTVLLGVGVSCANSQIPLYLFDEGVQFTYSVNGLTTDQDYPNDPLKFAFEISVKIKGGRGFSESKNLIEPGFNERTTCFDKKFAIFNIDSLKLSSQGKYIRFEYSDRPPSSDLFEPSFYVREMPTLELLKGRIPLNGVYSFESGGLRYEIRRDSSSKMISYAKITYPQGTYRETKVKSFREFMGRQIPEHVVWEETFTKAKEVKEFKLLSIGSLSKLEIPFTRSSLPVGSQLVDKVALKNFLVDPTGRLREVSRIKPPTNNKDDNRKNAPSARFLALSVSLILAGIGLQRFLSRR